MNWYRQIKQAQIWDVYSDGSFIDELKRLYELEYKWAALQNLPFNGMPQRRENILQNVTEELWEVINNVKEPIVKTISGWLSSHAITDPSQWANARVADMEKYNPGGGIGNDEFKGVLSEYMRYTDPNWGKDYWSEPNWNIAFSQMMSHVVDNIEAYPSINRMLDILVEDRKEMMRQTYYDYGIESFNEEYGQNFSTEEEVENFIESQTVESLGLAYDLLDYYDLDTFITAANELGILNNITRELYQNLVFPAWYDKWSGEGIDATREAVEDIYQHLQRASSVGDHIAAINLGLNAVHQTGDMTDYLNEYGGVEDDVSNIKDILEDLSEGENSEEWDEELRQIGIQI